MQLACISECNLKTMKSRINKCTHCAESSPQMWLGNKNDYWKENNCILYLTIIMIITCTMYMLRLQLHVLYLYVRMCVYVYNTTYTPVLARVHSLVIWSLYNFTTFGSFFEVPILFIHRQNISNPPLHLRGRRLIIHVVLFLLLVADEHWINVCCSTCVWNRSTCTHVHVCAWLVNKLLDTCTCTIKSSRCLSDYTC